MAAMLSLSENEASSRTTRIDKVTCRFCTRVTRARTTESTAGRVLYLGFFVPATVVAVAVVAGAAGFCTTPLGPMLPTPERRTLSIDLVTFDLVCPGSCSTNTGPGMEAQITPFWTWVPAPGRYVDVVASCWPGTARVGRGFSMPRLF